jgi:hypothetical protein
MAIVSTVLWNGLTGPTVRADAHITRLSSHCLYALVDFTRGHFQLLCNMQAVIIPEGGHHLDLMFSTPHDPTSVRQARRHEKHQISRWIDEYHMAHVQATVAS